MSVDVVVVVPARDEQDGIARTLRGVCASLDLAREQGLVDRSAVEVVAHRCTDLTAVRAGGVLRNRDDARVTRDETSVTVGQVRDAGVRRGLERLGGDPARTWVLSTDADTDVGTGWVGRILAAARGGDADAVVGVTTLDRWLGSPEASAAYDRLLREKTHGDTHLHVYGANLAVRADAYLDAGGFPHAVHGEDQALVDALDAGGHRLLRTTAVTVVTSGRLVGRATGGLADRLAGLEPSEGVA
jgi:hypothetical protein